jgi:general secretion pathway protein H
LTVNHRSLGFTLLELMVVLVIIALGTAGVAVAMRDGAQSQLEREAMRLSALLESARARSQVSGVPVRWQVSAQGFVFSGLQPPAGDETQLPETWIDPDTRAEVQALPAAGGQAQDLLLGPEPIIAPQTVRLFSASQPEHSLTLATDGVRPFALQLVP